jgi:hypothetical protein
LGGPLEKLPTAEHHVIASFLYPFRGERWLRLWLAGIGLVALLPLTFAVVFGYAVACVRTAACHPSAPPPSWPIRPGLLRDGAWSALQAAVLTAPFALVARLLDSLVAHVWHPTGGPLLDSALAWIVAVAAAALPWGVLMLVVVPPTLASFAVTGRASDLARLQLVVACVRDRYADWNLVVVGITTAWALAAIGFGVVGLGIVPGAFYAILVSAHACSALAPHRTAG